jgi:hypothetical protein
VPCLTRGVDDWNLPGIGWSAVGHYVRKPDNFFLLFFQEGGAVITWQQLHLFRRLTTTLILSMMEYVLTQEKYYVAHSMTTVPM